MVEAIEGIELIATGVPSLIMRDLSEYVTLPFLAAFHTGPALMSASGSPATPVPASVRRQVTYIGLSKKAMPSLVEMFLRFRHNAEIYEDGTLEAVLAVRSFSLALSSLTYHLLSRRIPSR